VAGVINQVSDTRWYNSLATGDDQPLPDFFDVLPNLSYVDVVVDILLNTLLGGTLIGIMIISPNWQTRGIILLRIGWLAGLLYLYRALTISVTTLPATFKDCKPQNIDVKTAAQVVGDAFKIIVGGARTCTDLIYSGHTMVFVTCAIQWRLYCKHRWVAWYVYLHAATGILMVIMTRFHYTVDCILSIFITFGFWSIYMAVVRMAMERFRYIKDHEQVFGMTAWEKDDADYQKVAYTPRMMNSGLVRIVVWMDALDVRWQQVYGSRPHSDSTEGEMTLVTSV
jgi:hypothetical protein